MQQLDHYGWGISWRWMIWCVLLVMHLTCVDGVLGQAYIKVNKPLITVMAPTSTGLVQVTGVAQSISSTDLFTAKVTNLNTKESTVITVNDDHSFTAMIAGKSGDQLRVIATTANKKRSYGTFSVPEGTTSANSNTSPGLSLKNATALPKPMKDTISDQAIPKGDNARNNLEFILIAIDPKQGQIIATERITGEINRSPDSEQKVATVIQSIISECKLVISDYLVHSEERDTGIKIQKDAPSTPEKASTAKK